MESCLTLLNTQKAQHHRGPQKGSKEQVKMAAAPWQVEAMPQRPGSATTTLLVGMVEGASSLPRITTANWSKRLNVF